MVETRSQRKAIPTSATNNNDGNETNNQEESNGHLNDHKGPIVTATSQPQAQPQAQPHAAASTAVTAVTTKPTKTPMVTIVSLVLIVLITLFTYPDTLQPVGRPTLNHVWYFGWISALSTGLGVLPLIFSPTLDSWWIGVTNGELVVWFWFHLIRCDVM